MRRSSELSPSRFPQCHTAGFFVAVAILSVVLLATAAASIASAGPHLHLVPHFSTGQTLRYSVQLRMETSAAATGPITNAGGPKQLTQSVGVIIRLQILSVSDSPADSPSARIRATYEKSVATSEGAAGDPDVAAMDDQYQKLAGQSIEFTLQSDGKITGVSGLTELSSDPSRAAVLNQWLSQLTLGASLPKHGIAIGEKWSSQQSLANAPLDGLVWKTTSTYLRDEPCPAAAQAPASAGKPVTPAAAPEQCAVILSRSEIVGGSQPKDRTPAVFRQNGLRSSGIWTGSTESLTAISLRSGMVSSVTQTGSTHVDFTIMTAAHGNRMRYAGDTHSQSEISLLSPSAAP